MIRAKTVPSPRSAQDAVQLDPGVDDGASPPLVVDLDGTLIRTDLLYETASAHLVRSPHSILQLAMWLSRGRANLKRELMARTELDVASLPYREELVQWLREEKSRGRRIVLASAADSQAVRAIADHLGLFDEFIGSDGVTNLRSEAKRAVLVERFGARGFDYVGNSAQDLAIWPAASTAHLAAAPRSVTKRAQAVAPIGRSFDPPDRPRLPLILEEMRLYQWAKNALVLVPVVLAHLVSHASADAYALVAFVSFCLTSSSVYVLNDLIDVVADRHHPTKRRRPFASGRLPLPVGWALWPLLAAAGIALAAGLLPLEFLAVLLSYLALTMAYSLWLKRQPVMDVIVLACLYTLRVIAGAVAVNAILTVWLLAFSIFLFLGLALTKRVSELTRIRRELSGAADASLATAARGRGYVESDLELLSTAGVASSIASIVIFTLYIDDSNTTALYHAPEILWLNVPLLLAWVLRIWLIAHRGEMNEDPIVFALRDRLSCAAGLCVLLVFLASELVR